MAASVDMTHRHWAMSNVVTARGLSGFAGCGFRLIGIATVFTGSFSKPVRFQSVSLGWIGIRLDRTRLPVFVCKTIASRTMRSPRRETAAASNRSRGPQPCENRQPFVVRNFAPFRSAI